MLTDADLQLVRDTQSQMSHMANAGLGVQGRLNVHPFSEVGFHDISLALSMLSNHFAHFPSRCNPAAALKRSHITFNILSIVLISSQQLAVEMPHTT